MSRISDLTVHVVDDDEMVHVMLSSVFDKANIVMRAYRSGEEFLQTYKSTHPECLIVDLMMPGGMGGLELQQAMKGQGSRIPTIFLSGADEVHMAVEALTEGAIDYIEKPPRREKLFDCLERARNLDLNNQRQHQDLIEVRKNLLKLTPREFEVMRWMLKALPNKTIAKNLEISVRTVEIHRKNLLQKMGVASAMELLHSITEVQDGMDQGELRSLMTDCDASPLKLDPPGL